MMDYKEQYLKYCARLNRCTTKAEVRKHNAAMKQLSKLYHQVENEEDKSFLAELLCNENNRTRVLVAAHCLGLGVYVSEALEVLSILENHSDPFISFPARGTLLVWKKRGYLIL